MYYNSFTRKQKIYLSLIEVAKPQLAHMDVYLLNDYYEGSSTDLNITICIGLAVSNKEISIYELTDKADILLYKAKYRGKNRIYYREF